MSKDLFRGTVPYYSRYRVPYPEPLLAKIRTKSALSGQGSLLDLGCGTGEIALRMAPFFRDVTAVDIDPEMLAAAEQKAQKRGIETIQWLNQSAEQFSADTDSFELVTIGAAFHWMDRRTIAERVREWLQPGKPLVVLGYTSIWSGTADWLPLVQTVIKKWLGEKRRAGSGEFPDAIDPHELVLTKSGYTLDEFEYQHPHTWTLDELIGNLYSTSFASPAVLGDKQSAFEADLRKTLLDYNSSGTYQEEMTFYALIATPY
ncbi:class I SAM-dependent methyltransferase [Gimesia fumaroli]|uniref:Putative methyltransferase YcgJ n=1 Tax=Gimesia fumaroli TaxID=2527976 RepID=A0A518IHM6_9PLAN|nr:class I SAM-dependent methyltransferase [Gimesia fumaroli]QDV52587.1 putative methyltransferase YcgJ [Gimesia fumaroli]